MSIATAITDLSGRIQDAYTALENKGATMPATKNTVNLPATISSIPTGSPSVYGISSVTQIIGKPDVNGTLVFDDPVDIVFSGIKAINADGMQYRFQKNPNIRAVTFPDLEIVESSGLNYAFSNSGITSISFPKLKTINKPSALYYMCNGAANLSSVNFPALETIEVPTAGERNPMLAYAFSGTRVTSITFPRLKKLYGSTSTASNTRNIMSNIFTNNAGDLYFPVLDDIYGGIFSGAAGLTVHFAAANKTAIESASGYSSKFGNTNGTILFDL